MSIQLVIIHIIELIAALAGTYYYLKTDDKLLKPFVWYLWFVVLVETLGMYGYIMQYNFDNEIFIWIKNSGFCENRWLYNIYSFASIIFFWVFYKGIIKNNNAKRFLDILAITYIIFTIGFFLFSDSFFVKSIPYEGFFETLFIVAAGILYFRQLLTSDRILYFFKEPMFYISIGLFIWHLIILPLFIFDGYFYSINVRFLDFRLNYLLLANLFLYLCYTFGFIYTLRFKKK